MKEDVFKSYAKKVKPIIDDCVVSAQVAESDPNKYAIYVMHQQENKGIRVGYDKEKAKKHTDELKEIFTEIPRGKVLSLSVTFVQDLLNDTTVDYIKRLESINLEPTKKEEIRQKLSKQIIQQFNSAEIFLALAEEAGIVSPIVATNKNKDVFYVLMEQHISTTYKGSPTMELRNQERD